MAYHKSPYSDTTLTNYLDYKIDAIKGIKTEQDIAAEMGFLEARDIARLRTGEESLPLDWIAGLAQAINAVPINLCRLALDQRSPTLQESFAETFGAIATPNEAHLFLRKWREVTDDRDPVNDASGQGSHQPYVRRREEFAGGWLGRRPGLRGVVDLAAGLTL